MVGCSRPPGERGQKRDCGGKLGGNGPRGWSRPRYAHAGHHCHLPARQGHHGGQWRGSGRCSLPFPFPFPFPCPSGLPAGRSLLPPGTCLPPGCSVRFPAQKAGGFSRFLTICCGRYSLECSPLIFFAQGTGGPGAGPGQAVASSWCLNWVFTCCWGSPRAPRGGDGPHPDTTGSGGAGEQVLQPGGGGQELWVSVLGSSLPPEELWREHPPETAERHFDLVRYHYRHMALSSSNSLLQAQGPCSGQVPLGSCPCRAGALRLGGSGHLQVGTARREVLGGHGSPVSRCPV